MKLSRYIKTALAVAVLPAMTACTDLDEVLYNQVEAGNYFNNRQDVVRLVFRPFEHAFWSIQYRNMINEMSADMQIRPYRDSWFTEDDWSRYHYHTWDTEANPDAIAHEWNADFQGIGQCNYVIEALEDLDLSKFGISDTEADNFKAQNRALRAWFYLRLLDAYRNVPYVVSFNDQTLNTTKQVEPRKIFDFIESELKDCMHLLVKKEALGTQPSLQGSFTQAAAAAILMRLYLNAEVYIGEDRYAQCAAIGEDIQKGVYGPYEIANRWDAVFDWDNETCDEVILGFPADGGYTYWHMQWETFWMTVPFNSQYYFDDRKAKAGEHSCGWAAAPSLDLSGNYYTTELGCPVRNFQKYPSDIRLRMYRNLGNGKREGMFLFGYLEYKDPTTGQPTRLKSITAGHDLYLRDAVGVFHDMAPTAWPSDKTSNMHTGDMNSGWHYVKYPFYSDDDEHQLKSDFTEIRYSEVLYMLAECYLRLGDKDADAGKLLNSVRKRCYPAKDYADVLYMPEGNVKLDLTEMLQEWGREFFAESRRRIDLNRFGKFHTGTWWDKTPDADNHTCIFPISRYALNTNPDLVQNPGYAN